VEGYFFWITNFCEWHEGHEFSWDFDWLRFALVARIVDPDGFFGITIIFLGGFVRKSVTQPVAG
jgi:hypothetical protein